MYIQAWNTYSYIFEDTHLHTRIKHFGMHTGNHILYMYNININAQIQTHMNIWTLIKIYSCMYAAIGYDS